MRRMTISRSDLTTLAALCALAAPLAAQVRAPNIQRPIQAAQGAASQTNQNIQAQQAPSTEQQPAEPGRRTVELGNSGTVLVQGSQNPGSHVVQQGETLWGLAQQYLGDPTLWPEIYRLNTNVVEDPHWIYPGEELRLSAPADTIVAGQATVPVESQNLTVTPSGDSTPAISPAYSENAPTIFNTPSSRVRGGLTVEALTARGYRAVREGEYFASGFLTENQPLNTGRVVSTSGEMRDVARQRTTAHIYERITLTAPTGEPLVPGDLMLAFSRGDEVGTMGEIVRPTGLVRVRGAAAGGTNLIEGTVVALYGSLGKDQELLKVQPFSNTSNSHARPITGGTEGTVLRMRENRNVAQMQDVFFIDKGANDGLRLGDVLQVYVTRPDAEHGGFVERDQARAIIVSTRSRTATAVIVELYRGDVGSQSQVRVIRRMPS